MKLLTTIVAVMVSLSCISCKEKEPLDPEGQLLIPYIIRSREYMVETHYVTTRDGYILAVYRIVNPLIEQSKTTPVLLYHGLLASSRGFLVASEGGFPWEDCKEVGNNLGFELAKRGYDVWLGNTRGNTYSRNHTTLDPKIDRAYWDFSMDEIIKYDVRSMVDYVLKARSVKTLAVVAHSQGTTATFGLMTLKPKYNKIIKPFIALAPVFSAHEVKSPAMKVYLTVEQVTHVLRDYREPFLPDTKLTRLLTQTACHLDFRDFCANLLFMVSGFNDNQLNRTRLPVYAGGYPAGTSSKNMLHITQTVKHKHLRHFDYGVDNILKYGQIYPPRYHLDKVSNKHIALFSSGNDWLASPGNVDQIRKELTVRPMIDYIVPHEHWNHFDFLMGIDVGKYINKPILNILDKYRQHNFQC